MRRRWYCYGMWAATSPIEKLRLHFANEIVTQNTKTKPEPKGIRNIFPQLRVWWWWHLTFLSSSLFFRIKQTQTEKTNNIQSNEKKKWTFWPIWFWGPLTQLSKTRYVMLHRTSFLYCFNWVGQLKVS
jgi:hypothetical protein